MELKHITTVEEIKEADDGERSIVHLITTEAEDRQGDIVRTKGMDDENYAKNPVVLYGHAYGSFPIGKSLWRKPTTRGGGKGIMAKTQFADTEEGRKAYTLWRDGFLNAASIGFMPKEWDEIRDDSGRVTGWDIKKWELWEYSIVPVPANAQALRLSLKELPGQLGALTREWLNEQRLCELEECKGKMEALPEVLKELIEQAREHERQIKGLEALIETLKTPPRVETVGRRVSDAELKRFVSDAVAGAVSRLKGKV